MVINGYKAFNSDFTNRYGKKFEIGKIYHTDKEIVYGNDGGGFHFCERFENTLRYFDGFNSSVVIAKIIARGKIVQVFDDYYGYLDLYACESLEILKFLSREELINMACNLSEDRMKRFVSLYKLRNDEINLFLGKYPSVDLAIDYYQKGLVDAYGKDNVIKKYLRKK